MHSTTPPEILVIGAGSTGSAIAYDLALRGFRVTLVERGGVASGTTGHNQAQLHSGARYVVVDPEAAKECVQENLLLRKILPGNLELNGGLFIELPESNVQYTQQFIEGCHNCQIQIRPLKKEETLTLEPNLTTNILSVFFVSEGTFDPYRFCLSFLTTAAFYGAKIYTYCEVTEITPTLIVTMFHYPTKSVITKKYDTVINAAGPWVDHVAKLAGVNASIEPSAGVIVTIEGRACNHVLNILAPPADGDIIVPQRNSCILGTTSWTVENPDHIQIPPHHVEYILQTAEKLIPDIRHYKVRGVTASARPLIRDESKGGRQTSRRFVCLHHDKQGVPGFFSVIGGKTTTARLIAEKICDSVCDYLNWNVVCKTAEKVLLSYRQWYRYCPYL